MSIQSTKKYFCLNCNLNIKYLLALLNSKLLDYYFRKTGKKKGEIIEYFSEPLSKIPIPKINFDNYKEKEIHDRLVRLASDIIQSYKLIAHHKKIKSNPLLLLEECKITDTTSLKLSPYIKNINIKNNSASSANIKGNTVHKAEDIIKISSEYDRVVEELKELPEFIKNMEDGIDNLVYDLYRLDEKEKAIVEEFCSGDVL